MLRASVLERSTPLYVNIEPTSFSVGGSGSVLVGLETHSSVKSKCLANAHSCGASYKKPKKLAAVSSVVNTFAGPLSLEDLSEAGAKPAVSWSSDIGSIASSVSSLLDVENMTNLVAKETSYVESGENDDMDKATLRKTHTRTYTLDNLIKQPLFNNALIEFESSKVVSLVASKWSVLVGKDSIRVILAVNDKQTWVSRDRHWAMLYTLFMDTSAHYLSDWLMLYSGKTCFIGRNPNKAARLAAVFTIPIFKGVSLHWTSLVLASCAKCEQFSHITVNCSVSGSPGICEKRVVSDHDQVCLTGIYKKKSAPIACLVLFGGKTWAQVASGTSSCAFPSGFSGSGLHSGSVPPSAVSDSLVVSHLSDYLAVLECFLELLANHVSGILVRLDSFGMVSSVPFSLASPPVASAALGSEVDSDMIVDNALGFPNITSPVIDDAVVDLSASSFKVLTAKVGSLETKLVALEASVDLVLNKLNFLCSGLGLLASTVSQ
ncbi:hypothetical protein G9A89_012418 [Geosiphon pyriformis]|nr:hypothetical protein G9A89_012418 [Geosiphon pyriformis]